MVLLLEKGRKWFGEGKGAPGGRGEVGGVCGDGKG